MKKLSIVLAIILVVSTVGLFTACNKHECESVCSICGKCLNADCSEKACQSKCTCQIAQDMGLHYVANTLHQRNITQTTTPFVATTIDGRSSDYVIITNLDDSYAAKAADLIKTHVKECTGVELTLADQHDYDEYVLNPESKYIVIGQNVGEITSGEHTQDSWFVQAGLSMPDVKLNTSGYYIKSYGNMVFLAPVSQDGYQMAAICFLEETIGYDMLAGDLTIYEKDGATMPNFDVVEQPDYEYRAVPQVVGNVGKYGMGYTPHDILMAVDSNVWHNSFAILDPAIYCRETIPETYHPKWYTDEAIAQKATKDNLYIGQLCYTAHGDADEYELMVQTATEKLIKTIEANPAIGIVNIGEQDNYNWCDCDACMDIINKYGAESATNLLFVNDVAERIKDYFSGEPGKGAKRDILVTFFAYHRTEKAPVTTDANGNYVGVDGIHCADNVGIVFAPIKAVYNHSFYEEENSLYADTQISWGAVCDNITVWYYETNFSQYLYPYNSWDTVAESYRFALENNAVTMYNEGQWDQKVTNGFGKLKEYLDAKLLINVNQNYGDLVDKFFKYYFGPAGATMRQYFDELQTHYEMLNNVYSTVLKGSISDPIADARFWPKSLLTQWNEACNKAMAEIESVKYSDPTKYQAYYDHILLESTFPKYALSTLHSGTYSDADLLKIRTDCMNSLEYFGIEAYKEHTTDLQALYQSWGLK